MLEVLRIKNIAIIDSAEINFKSGLNIISGETGTGKSIIIEAISLLLGCRASSDLIRSGCEEAVAEGLFSIDDVPWINARLSQAGFPHSTSELLIKRSVHRSGKHRISINGEMATLSILQSICEGLIDLCGQHEHQSLLKSSMQLDLLDRYGSLVEQVVEFAKSWGALKKLQRELEQLTRSETELSKRRDFLKFQLDEIQVANLSANEDDLLHAEKQNLQSAEARIQAVEGARVLLESEESGALNSLKLALQKMRSVLAMDEENLRPMLETLQRAVAESEDATLSINRYLAGIDLSGDRLQYVQDRLALIANLRRKYGATVNAILATGQRINEELNSLEHTTERAEEIQANIGEISREVTKLGKKLSQGRKKIAEKFSTSIMQELKDLNMGDARFQIEVGLKERIEDWNQTGGDAVQFVVRTNPGEPAKPLSKIVSGGELSRLMLSIRRVISDRGGIGVYLFDEIDSGIGGHTAFQVGKKLKSVAQFNQVICITHLPQVASFANHHLTVRKRSANNRTVTEIAELNMSERKNEVARMLGGPTLTKRNLENASELLEMAGGGA